MVSEIDKKILIELLKNARVSWSDLASRLKVNESTIRYRVNKLRREGVLIGYQVIINYGKAGFTASLTGIDVDPDKLWNVIEELKSISSVTRLLLTTGDHTLIAEIVSQDKDALEQTHRHIASIPGVRRVCPSIIMDICK